MAKEYKISSSKDPQIQYEVTLDHNGFGLKCSCPHYKYRHDCKHIKIAQKKFDEEKPTVVT